MIAKLYTTQEYAEANPGKNWDCPKPHLNQHSYDDVDEKGVTPNFNTKMFERRHGEPKIVYARLINGKNVTVQVCARVISFHNLKLTLFRISFSNSSTGSGFV